jgi:hypothetical protein
MSATHPAIRGARELTDQEWADWGDRARSIEHRVFEAIEGGRRALWALAEALYDFNEDKGWLALDYETAGAWLAQPEIGVRPSSYYNLVRMWRVLVVERGADSKRLEKLDASKAVVVLPSVVKHRTTIEDALADVEALPWRDLREKYRHSPTEPASDVPMAEDDLEAAEVIEGDIEPLHVAWGEVDQAIAANIPHPRVARTSLIALRDHYRSESDGSPA